MDSKTSNIRQHTSVVGPVLFFIYSHWLSPGPGPGRMLLYAFTLEPSTLHAKQRHGEQWVNAPIFQVIEIVRQPWDCSLDGIAHDFRCPGLHPMHSLKMLGLCLILSAPVTIEFRTRPLLSTRRNSGVNIVNSHNHVTTKLPGFSVFRRNSSENYFHLSWTVY